MLGEVKKAVADAKGVTATTESALGVVTNLAKTLKSASEPFTVPLLPALLERLLDKAESTRAASLAATAGAPCLARPLRLFHQLAMK